MIKTAKKEFLNSNKAETPQPKHREYYGDKERKKEKTHQEISRQKPVEMRAEKFIQKQLKMSQTRSERIGDDEEFHDDEK